jgi:outer membrane murein-binding lipoprotein Lpp
MLIAWPARDRAAARDQWNLFPKENLMTNSRFLMGRSIRSLMLMSGCAVTAVAAQTPVLMPAPMRTVVVLTTEQQLAQLQQQVQYLQAQLAALQATVQITAAGAPGQEPTLTLAAGHIVLRASNTLTLRSGSDTSMKVSGALELQSSAGTRVRAGGSLLLDGSMVSLNGGTRSLATVGSVVQTTVPVGTTGGTTVAQGQVVSGSQNVFSN